MGEKIEKRRQEGKETGKRGKKRKNDEKTQREDKKDYMNIVIRILIARDNSGKRKNIKEE